ncbi:MAG: hypothetical protein NTY19_47805 [Planctomycetota bacterium]|nr:hypothetical protein [Planctomycetota bacterium]
MIRRTILLAAVVLAAVQAPAQDARPLRVYFVGNSVTDTINYRALAYSYCADMPSTRLTYRCLQCPSQLGRRVRTGS